MLPAVLKERAGCPINSLFVGERDRRRRRKKKSVSRRRDRKKGGKEMLMEERFLKDFLWFCNTDYNNKFRQTFNSSFGLCFFGGKTG